MGPLWVAAGGEVHWSWVVPCAFIAHIPYEIPTPYRHIEEFPGVLRLALDNSSELHVVFFIFSPLWSLAMEGCTLDTVQERHGEHIMQVRLEGKGKSMIIWA